jgi:hypothetical protein
MRSFVATSVPSIARGLCCLRDASTSIFAIVFTVYFVFVMSLAGCGSTSTGASTSLPKTPTISWFAPAAITYGTAQPSLMRRQTLPEHLCILPQRAPCPRQERKRFR